MGSWTFQIYDMVDRVSIILLCLWLVAEISYLMPHNLKIYSLIISMVIGCGNMTFLILVCFNDHKTLLIKYLLMLLTCVFTILHMIDIILTLIKIKGDQGAFVNSIF